MKHLSALIVDTSPSYAQTVATCLKNLGFISERIYFAKKFEVAIEILETKRPQLLFTEFSVDGRYGLELVTQHASNSADNISIIMTHNNSSTSIAEAAEELVDDYIVKPFQSGTLQDRLKNLIMRKLNPNEYVRNIRAGKQMLIEGRLHDAELQFATAAQIQERPTLAYYYLGYTKFMEEQFSEAAGEYGKGLDLQPLHYKCLTGKFDTFIEQKSYNEAYALATSIVDNYPIGPKRLGQFFIAAVFSGKLDAVPRYYKLFAQLDHKTPELRRVFSAALYTAGRSQINQQNITAAVECFEMGLQVLGPNTEYLTKVIKTLLKTDSQGHTHALRLLRQFPNGQIGSKEFDNLSFLVNCKTLPTAQIIDQGRKLASQGRLDAEGYEVFVKILLDNNKAVLAEDIMAKALREYPTLRQTFNNMSEA